jgi:hypothetical protein
VKKEVLIAIIIGFGLGLVLTFGIWSANKTMKEPTETAPSPTPAKETTPTPTPQLGFSLTITSPEDGSISAEDEVTVSGQTTPRAIVVMIYQEGEKILEADEEGLFSTKVSLAGGVNEIQISAHDREGNEAEETITVVYSTAEI